MISSHSMTKLLKKGHQGVIAQLCSLDVQTSKSCISPNLRKVMDTHSKVFEDVPKGLPVKVNLDSGMSQVVFVSACGFGNMV